MEDMIANQIAERVVAMLEQKKFCVEQKHWPEVLEWEPAAEYMSRTVPAIRNLIRTGQIPAMRRDRKVQLRKCDIDAWAARMTERISA